MVSPTVWALQMLGKLFLWHRYNPARPACRFTDGAHPLQFRQHVCLAGIVNPANRASVRRGQYDSGSDVLDVAAARTPARPCLAQKNTRPAIVHALQVFECAMLLVAWTIDKRQTQDRNRQFGVLEDGALDKD